jgi:hypothetical protein
MRHVVGNQVGPEVVALVDDAPERIRWPEISGARTMLGPAIIMIGVR